MEVSYHSDAVESNSNFQNSFISFLQENDCDMIHTMDPDVNEFNLFKRDSLNSEERLKN